MGEEMGTPAPGTPPPRKRKLPAQDSEKLRSLYIRPALARALAAIRGPSPAEDHAAQLRQALQNYEAFHGLSRGTARAEDVVNSSAGVQGWAEAHSGRTMQEQVRRSQLVLTPVPVFSSPSLADDMLLARHS